MGTKLRTTLRFSEKTVKKIEAYMLLESIGSRAEFVEKAVEHYIGALAVKNSSTVLGEAIHNTMNGIVADSENRIARLLFKEAVEMAKLTQIIAYVSDVDEDTIQSLHKRCVNEVKKINGTVNFEDAYRFQKSSDTDNLL